MFANVFLGRRTVKRKNKKKTKKKKEKYFYFFFLLKTVTKLENAISFESVQTAVTGMRRTKYTASGSTDVVHVAASVMDESRAANVGPDTRERRGPNAATGPGGVWRVRATTTGTQRDGRTTDALVAGNSALGDRAARRRPIFGLVAAPPLVR